MANNCSLGMIGGDLLLFAANSLLVTWTLGLNKIIISESSKAYHTKAIDSENKKGYYKTYKRVVQRVSDLVTEINPSYEFPHMLISTVIEGAHHQRYFSKHLPSLTDFEEGKNNIVRFYTDLVFNTLSEK